MNSKSLRTSVLLMSALLALTACTTEKKDEIVNKVANDVKNEVTAGQNGAGKTYTLAEVAQHSVKTDCWMAIEGKVYDLTVFVAGGTHPGGAVILEGCGKDATELFNTQGGEGTDHSILADQMRDDFAIGTLAE